MLKSKPLQIFHEVMIFKVFIVKITFLKCYSAYLVTCTAHKGFCCFFSARAYIRIQGKHPTCSKRASYLGKTSDLILQN